ncbi:MAG: L-ribulose-5-phosphate 4-epimerase AraD [Phycisphaerae bacterium]|nr:L-ribulose-5-phosphate 4-epimerase AraD [Phycisphaerae bacterium]
MLDDLKQRVCDANKRLVDEGLVMMTFGNVSGIDRDGGHVVIKPSGVAYDDLRPETMVVVSVADGETVEGDARPSSDTPTHLELYRAFDAIGGVVHTHSVHATAWAQARRPIPRLGTTHADHFSGPVPCTRPLTPQEIEADYEANTGKVLVEALGETDPLASPAALVVSHGPFAWGRDPNEAVTHAAILEYVARLATETVRIEPYPRPAADELMDKHFNRKHGPNAYYGQADEGETNR